MQNDKRLEMLFMPHPPVIRFSYASRFLSGCTVSHMIHLHVLFFTEKRLFYSHIKYITLDDALSSIFRKDVNFFCRCGFEKKLFPQG